MTINLEQAKRLWELGVRKEAEKSWAVWELIGEQSLYLTSSCKDMRFKEGKTYYAYNAEELIAMIKTPMMFSINNGYVTMQASNSEQITYLELAKITLTEALANKLIYDIENGIITPEEINK